MSGTVAAVVPLSVFTAYQKWVGAHQGAKAEAATNFYHFNTAGLTVGDVYSFGVSPAIALAYKEFTDATKNYVPPKTKTTVTRPVVKTVPAKVIPLVAGVKTTTDDPAAAKAEAAYVLKNCPKASYGGNIKWLPLVNHECQPVVTKTCYWSESEKKNLCVYQINTSANQVVAVTPSAKHPLTISGGTIKGAFCVGFTDA